MSQETSHHIEENTLDGILNATDIVELISGYIPLKRAGRNFRANCPFHHEKTPSFMVSQDKQIYHCFGCGTGGNAFNFLMQYEKMEFLEAVNTLAQKACIVIPRKDTARADGLHATLYKINELAAEFYANNLQSPSGSYAKNYLLNRGLTDETIKLFKLGIASDRWNDLINNLRAKNISLGLLEKAGLILSKEKGGYYDRFRKRVIFPVWDVKSRAVAFGARVTDDTLPKYINSPETPIYIKGKNLYGLNFSKNEIRDKDCAIIVEGYLDFIIPYQHGLCNIVASLGTALTSDQIRLIKRYTNNIIMLYDGDTAGQMATLRTWDIFFEEGMNVRVASLPEQLDPDNIVRKFGIEKLHQIIREAEDLFCYQLKTFIHKNQINKNQLAGKERIKSQMLPIIKKVQDQILRGEYIKKLAEELGVNEQFVLDEYNKLKEINKSSGQESYLTPKKHQTNPTENLLVKLMLEENELIDQIKDQLSPGDFQDTRLSRVVEAMFELANNGKTIEVKRFLTNFKDSDISNLICESTFLPQVNNEDRSSIVNDCIKRIKLRRLNLKKEQLHNRIKNAQACGDHDSLKSLMEEFTSLIKREVK